MENTNPMAPAGKLEEKSFEEVAKEIIKKSFRSAICIDNEYASAYSQNTALNSDEPRTLYHSFRNDAFCDLDIFEFTSFDDSWKAHMGENKDLMILDWELDPGEKHESTLKILDDVITAKKIPFVVIYTNTEDIDSIARVLISKFNPVNEQRLEEFKATFNAKMAPITDTNSADFDSLLEKPEIFFEYIHVHTKRDASEARILEWIAEALGVKAAIKGPAIKSKVAALIKEVFPFVTKGRELEHLAFSILHDDIRKHVPLQRVKIVRPSYLIDNATTVVIFRKKDKDGGITPDKLFNEFAQTIINDPHNFISLLSLEMKDNIKENFSKIGAKFSKINEKAFLYHIGNYRKDGVFNKGTIYDFILRGWIYELFQQKVGEKSQVLDFIADRYQQQQIDEISQDDALFIELVRYSAYISTTDLSSKKDKPLWFGDVFKNEKSEYFLCITPHCDCSIPSKIKKNFYFIKGSIKADMKHALETAEQGYSSFIIDGAPICIEWKRKPFTSFVKDHTISTVSVTYSDETSELKYVTSLKENYTQRISNEAFGYGYRVGIDLPHLQGEKAEEGQ